MAEDWNIISHGQLDKVFPCLSYCLEPAWTCNLTSLTIYCKELMDTKYASSLAELDYFEMLPRSGRTC